jgi:hypothetical protein
MQDNRQQQYTPSDEEVILMEQHILLPKAVTPQYNKGYSTHQGTIIPMSTPIIAHRDNDTATQVL